MNRLLSRREKDGSSHKREKSRDKNADRKTVTFPRSLFSISAAFSSPQGKASPVLQTTYSTVHSTSTDIRLRSFSQSRPLSGADAVLALFKADPEKKSEKEHTNKINAIKQRLQKNGYSGVEDEHLNYALASQYADGDVDKAYEMVILFQESVEGVIHPYDPEVEMLGAENRELVTCYLDSLLFAMFARLGSFEPILYTNFDDEPKRRLSTLIRLWVNMLRTGKLIQTDITRYLQEALAACGWEDAARIQQQDTSEAFRFIAETLDLPLLTLKVDIFHHAAEDDKDDHKFVQERLLDVAVEETEDGRELRLENCLEDYFNNKVEVTRKLRTYTISSIQSGQLPDPEKEETQHIEVAEMSTPNTPISIQSPSSPFAPNLRRRATSVIRTRILEGQALPEEKEHAEVSDANSTPHSLRKKSLRKEVTIPAWQFFNLIPWYTNRNFPPNASDAGVAAHFSQSRPLLGICLKRYGMKDGKPYKTNTPVDIPQEMRLPHFIEDGRIPEDNDQIGNFKLSLQSVICHRGKSVNEGHYVCLVRGNSLIPDGDSRSSRRLSSSSLPPHYSEDQWYKFDDLANPRVRNVDYEEEIKRETPYLLFYQVVPIYPTMTAALDPDQRPPSYTDSGIAMRSTNPDPSSEKEPTQAQGYFDGVKEEIPPVIRLSAEGERPPTPPRENTNIPSDRPDTRRGSLAYTEHSLASTTPSILATSAPVTPAEETTAQRVSRAAARFTKSGNKSRPTSQSGESRISATFSRLNLMRSKEQLSKVEVSKETLSSTDGVSEPRKSVTIDDRSLITGDKHSERSKSKKEKKRNKSREPSEKLDHESGHHKGKRKASDGPDRECRLM